MAYKHERLTAAPGAASLSLRIPRSRLCLFAFVIFLVVGVPILVSVVVVLATIIDDVESDGHQGDDEH